MRNSDPLSSPSPARGALRILYVEDDEKFRSVVAAFLRGHGHFVETAGDGADALLRITRAVSTGGAYDVLITDLHMPLLDGMGLIRAVRKAGLPIRIIIYSSESMPEESEELAELMVDATVPKGTRPGFLAATVAKVGSLME